MMRLGLTVLLGFSLFAIVSLGTASREQSGTAAQGTPSPISASGGLSAWQEIYSVMSHSRCINCHTASDYPQQGDDRHRHLFNVVRGPDGKGVPALQCASCHQQANADSTGVPGAPDWHLAPLSMKWQDSTDSILPSSAVCKTVSDPAKNGGLDGGALIKHHQTELVKWAWKPGFRNDGTARSVPPIGYEEFMAATRTWVQAGMPCPQ